MGIYTACSLLAVATTLGLERFVFRSGIFGQPAYWISMGIVYAFMVPVDGWLTKISAPIVIYRDGALSGLRPLWDIPLEDFLYAFALITVVILFWDRADTSDDADRAAAPAAEQSPVVAQ